MITIYCPRYSEGADELSVYINKHYQSCRYVKSRTQPDGSLYWGYGGGNKFRELQLIAKAGVPVPEHQYEHPGETAIRNGSWVARSYNHAEAEDLLRGELYGDYYVRFVPVVREHRVHIFDGRSILVQKKVPRPGRDANPRFRSFKAGWTLHASPQYTREVPDDARDFAKKAVKAMGYVFGAVDIGVKADGTSIVWEVNTQPGIDHPSEFEAYANAIVRYSNK